MTRLISIVSKLIIVAFDVVSVVSVAVVVLVDPRCIFLKIIKRVALQSSWIGTSNPVGIESSFHFGWKE